MNHSLYLDWYVSVPKVKYDLRSSGITRLKQDLVFCQIDFSANYVYGNPVASEVLSSRYTHTRPGNIFISCEGASCQNERIIKLLAERNKGKHEAIVEFPTYEPLLRKVQRHFRYIKRLERNERENYRLNADDLNNIVSERTALLVLTNPHAPSGWKSDKRELGQIVSIANEHGFYVLCNEIYAEFNRNAVSSAFSINPDLCISTTSLTKAFGLGGLRLGIALAKEDFVKALYKDVLNTVGNSSNLVQLIGIELLTKHYEELLRYRQKWLPLKRIVEKWLNDKNLKYFPNRYGVTYWVELPIADTFKWVSNDAIPNYSLATVPRAFFLFNDDYRLVKSSNIRLGLGNLDPERSKLVEALEVMEKTLN